MMPALRDPGINSPLALLRVLVVAASLLWPALVGMEWICQRLQEVEKERQKREYYQTEDLIVAQGKAALVRAVIAC